MNGPGKLLGVVDLIPGVAVVVYEGLAVLRVGGVAVYTIALEAFVEGVSAQLMRILEAGLAKVFGEELKSLVALSVELRPTDPRSRVVLETEDGFPLWDYTASGIPTAEQLKESYRLTRAMADGLANDS